MLARTRRHAGHLLFSPSPLSQSSRQQIEQRIRTTHRLLTTTRSLAQTTAAAPKPTQSTPPSKPSTPSRPYDLTTGLLDPLPSPDTTDTNVDWSRSFAGLSSTSFPPEASAILLEPVSPQDVEVKPDGIIYLPEIKYRRILNRAFGPGAWGLAPRGETIITPKSVTREFALVVQGR